MQAGTFGAKPGTFNDKIKKMTFCLLLAHCALYTYFEIENEFINPISHGVFDRNIFMGGHKDPQPNTGLNRSS